MVRLVLLRLLESYFRRWFLYPLPIVLLVAVAMLSTLRAKPTFVAVGALYVQKESLLATLTSIQNTGFAWVTPAQATVDEFKELIQTDSFIRAIIKQTDLESAMDGGDAAVRRLIADTRRSIWVQPLGNNLIQVGAVDEQGPLAEQMAQALVEAYIQWRISADLEESASAQAFFENLVQTYEDDWAAAREAQHVFLEEYPDPVRGDRPTVEQVQLSQLQAAVDEANMRLTKAMEKLESAKLALAQSESKARQTYRLLDVPDAPPKFESSKTKLAINVAIMAAVGVILAVVGTVGAALLDSSYRFPIDVQNSLNLPVLAVVPDAAPAGNARPAQAGRRGREAQK